MQKLSSFGRGKKIRPKKSLMCFLHAALQLFFSPIAKLKTRKMCSENFQEIFKSWENKGEQGRS